ncbi:MAG: DUF5688 family protein [Lachnospiraceae bacterium]|nr:DUF5688 family protein [Lachnospiraceae bacterium]
MDQKNNLNKDKIEKIMSSYENVKDRLIVRMVSSKENKEWLSNVPHHNVEDMAAVYRIVLTKNEQGLTSIPFDNRLLAHYGITKKQLHEDAIESESKHYPLKIQCITEVLKGMADIPFGSEEIPLFVATNELSLNGAGVITYPDFMEQASKRLKGDFYMLPSSIHEVLLIAESEAGDYHDLLDMVKEVNKTVVMPHERLTNNVYHYDSKEKIFEMAASYVERCNGLDDKQIQEEKLNVLLVKPEKRPQQIKIDDSLETLQKVVGGNIQVICPFEDPVGLITNEEGKIEHLPLNRSLKKDNGQMQDIISGDFLVVGLTKDRFESLSQDMMQKYEKRFHEPEVFIKMGKGMMAISVTGDCMKAMDNGEKGTEIKNPKAKKAKKNQKEER